MSISIEEQDHAVETSATAHDPLLLDADGLAELASEVIVQRGVTYFKEKRVVGVVSIDGQVRSNVEGSDPNQPYVVEIGIDPDGGIVADCSCPFDWEPVCKHAIATLLAYAEEATTDEASVANAADEAAVERKRKGRTEVIVKHVAGSPRFGTWSARSVTPTGGIARQYRVQIRSQEERLNRCSCADFAYNHLGTCKHIEAVLHKLSKRRQGKGRRTVAELSVPVVYLAWDVPSPPRVRIHLPERLAGETREALDRHFDEQLFLRGELPGALYELERDVDSRFELDIGDDTREYVQRVGEQAAQKERAREVTEAIRHSGGQIRGVRARLYPYQVEGVAFLAAKGRALLADDMGLGKTLQAIAAATWLSQHQGVERTLVLCPASLKHQWAREIHRFTDFDVEVVQGGVQTRKAQYRRRAAFTIVNYELVLRDYDVIAKNLVPDLLVLDEAQRIKNWRTKTATAVKTLSSRYAFVLSGTPLENRLDDLYSVMQVVDQRALGPLWRFMLDFHITDERGKVLGYRNLSELRRQLQPLMLRRDRRLVEEQLPPRVERQLDVPMTQKQRDLHDAALSTAATLGQIAARRPLTPSEEKRLLASLQSARMACNAAGLVDGKTEGSPKLAELGRLLEELCLDGGAKVVVFSQWERMTRMAKEVAEGLGLGVLRLHGGVPTRQRGALISRFETDPGSQVFLSTDAGSVGLNLQVANVLINLDLPWNPAVLDQRIGRIHRLGQKKTAQVVLLIAADSYEQRIRTTLSGKRELFANVVGGEEGDDTLGLSKKVVEIAMESLATDGDEPLSEEDLAAAGQGGIAPDPAIPESPTGDPEDGAKQDLRPSPGPSPKSKRPSDETIAPVIDRLQSELGERIQRVLVTQSGLLAVVDQVDSETHELADLLSQEIPLAIVDGLTYRALERLGSGAPAEGAVEVWRSPEPSDEVTEPALTQLARRKLEAAEALVSGLCFVEAAGLLTQAMLAAMAERAGLDEPIAPPDAAVWLYGEAVSRGWVPAEDAAGVLRADALSRAASVPDDLAQAMLTEARRIVLGG